MCAETTTKKKQLSFIGIGGRLATSGVSVAVSVAADF
jgi:hypothetical protein